jgi:hypothetical protein
MGVGAARNPKKPKRKRGLASFKQSMNYKNQLSLNLVAIAVAGMTFSLLLGPLLHIPQTVPALITLAILGLAAIDQFGLQGRGAELGLDSLAQLSPKYRQRLIHHEAGHFLVAHLLGLPITDYSLSVWSAYQKGDANQVGVSLAVPAQINLAQAEPYTTVWMAGMAAEELVYGQSEGAANDRLQVQVISQALNLNPQQQQRQSLSKAKQLLESHWSIYEALVAAMNEQKPVSDCCRLLDQRLAA